MKKQFKADKKGRRKTVVRLIVRLPVSNRQTDRNIWTDKHRNRETERQLAW